MDENEIEDNSETVEKPSISGKLITFIIIAIIIIFGIVFSINIFKNKNPLTMDELHKRNLEGKESENNYMYNGFSFVKFDGLWFTQIEKDGYIIDVTLRFGPKDVEDVPILIDLSLIDAEKYPEIYMTINPFTNDPTYQTLAAAELSLNLVNAMGINPIAACTKQDNNACLNRDIINCSYDFAPIIYLQENDEYGVYQNNTCYVVQGQGFNLLKSVDRFIYNMYGIMP